MALVAFDLDNTLGYFSHIGVWADLFSLDNLENQFNFALNPNFKLSPALRKTLRAAEKLYIKKVLESPKIVKSILRPNLDAMILPLIHAKKKGKVRAICIYSNTWNTFTVHLGKVLIETIYNCENLFDCAIDASHPIRARDWLNKDQGKQIKTFAVLKSIFKELCNVKGTIRPSDILFVDERAEKHQIAEEVSEGLVYLKPTEYLPKVSMSLLHDIFDIGIEVLEESGLFKNRDYLESDVTRTIKFGEWNSDNKFIPITNVFELIQIAEETLRASGLQGHAFVDDTKEIKECMEKFFSSF